MKNRDRTNGSHAGVNPQEATIPEEQEEDLLESPVRKQKKDIVQIDASSLTKKSRKSNKKTRKKKTNEKLSQSPTGSSTTASTSTINEPRKNAETQLMMKRRKRRNGVASRVSYMASMGCDNDTNNTKRNRMGGRGGGDENSSKKPQSIPLPLNQYVTTLCRRAIRKREGDNNPPSPKIRSNNPRTKDGKKGEEEEQEVDNTTGLQLEEYGDISLGMNIGLVRGKVIVRGLNPLADGRASPAQVVGIIRRGDVLLSINNKSLVNLPINLMMERLGPLSTPDTTGAYQRWLQLRIEAGAGLELLEEEAAEARKASVASKNEASEVFSLFPMADHMSGVSSFETNIKLPHSTTTATNPAGQSKRRHPPQHRHQEEKKQTEEDAAAAAPSPSIQKLQDKKDNLQQQGLLEKHKFAGQKESSIDDLISRRVAEWRSSDRSSFVSEYYTWNETYSELLRPSEGRPKTAVPDDTKNDTNDRQLTKREMLELGRRAMLGAEKISRAVESLDRGKDMRSFRSWNSSISLRSGAGTRRRYVLDAVSLPVKFDSRTASPKGPNAGVSLASTEGSDMEEEDVDGDALLLRLAAHDEIWRSQVIDALKNARDKVADGAISDESDDDEDDVASNDDAEDPIAKELGAFLFGEKLAKVVKRKKKSKALPPDEITAVLFDLSTNLASTMPDEVAVGDGTASGGLKSSLVPFSGRRNPEAGSSVILATRFVLDEALGVWLETFRPLPWESRRVLWPQARPHQNGVDGRSQSMFSDNDSLTLDSGASPTTAFTNSTSATHSRDLRQQIEDQELDVETRAETCFLVTYYFTQRLLPKLAAGRTNDDVKATNELVAFVRRYGAYMKLHTSLAYAAALDCADVIDELLALAELDLRHREVMKLFSRRHALILYEPTMLSAVVKCLPIIREESSRERRQVLVDVCVTAYPDLCPWQVRQALVPKDDSKGDKKLEDLYYYYLSSLLHPQDGHEAARLDPALVEEWCELSLDAKSSNDDADSTSRMKNFHSVASLNSSDHLGYHRDLPMLIRLSMSSHQYHLSLDIANEIVSNPTLARDKSALQLVLGYLREIAQNALDKGDQHEMFLTLKRVVRLFQYMRESSDQQFFSIADELHGLMEYKERQRDSNRNLLELVHFLARESPPSDFLQAFNTWTATHQWPHDTVPVLQAVLKRGTRVALNAALSGSLLRLRRARQRMTKGREVPPPSTTFSPQEEEPTVWRKMAAGLVAIDK